MRRLTNRAGTHNNSDPPVPPSGLPTLGVLTRQDVDPALPTVIGETRLLTTEELLPSDAP